MHDSLDRRELSATEYLTAPQLRARLGNIGDTTLWRWLRNAKLGFPQPHLVKRRRLFRLDEIEAFECAHGGKFRGLNKRTRPTQLGEGYRPVAAWVARNPEKRRAHRAVHSAL